MALKHDLSLPLPAAFSRDICNSRWRIHGGGSMFDRRELLASGGLILAGALSGCVGRRDPFRTGGPSVSFESLVRQMKYDVGTYLWRHKGQKEALNRPGPNATPEEKAQFQQMLEAGQYRAARDGEACVGQVSISLVKVKLTVTTTVEQKDSGNLGLEVPLGIVTVSPSGSQTSTSNQSLTTTVEIYPTVNEDFEVVDDEPQPPGEFVGHPITDTLEALRSDLERTADTKPCFNFGVEQDQKTNSVKLGFTVTRAAGGGGKLKILFFSLGAESTQSRAVANTIEVFFVSRGEFG